MVRKKRNNKKVKVFYIEICGTQQNQYLKNGRELAMLKKPERTETRKTKRNKPEVTRRNKIIKISSEISGIKK
jgi:hypothetical protein